VEAHRWDEALTRIAKHMKADRDANLQVGREGRQGHHGEPLEHHRLPGVVGVQSNESGYLSVKVARGLGMVALDTQARI
jgi:formate dehydrogenase major subunit